MLFIYITWILYAGFWAAWIYIIREEEIWYHTHRVSHCFLHAAAFKGWIINCLS